MLLSLLSMCLLVLDIYVVTSLSYMPCCYCMHSACQFAFPKCLLHFCTERSNCLVILPVLREVSYCSDRRWTEKLLSYPKCWKEVAVECSDQLWTSVFSPSRPREQFFKKGMHSREIHLYCCDKTLTSSNLEGKVYLVYTSRSQSVIERCQV